MPTRCYGMLDLTHLGEKTSGDQNSTRMETYSEEKCIIEDDINVIKTYMKNYFEYKERKEMDQVDFNNWKILVGHHVKMILDQHKNDFLSYFDDDEQYWIKLAIIGNLN